jgi:hypothetical protein
MTKKSLLIISGVVIIQKEHRRSLVACSRCENVNSS